ncbi:hypothetical protein [Roseateles toxinivorans]|uniref:hypothetical protein n=1 Tax=Roseateles toxinivorans TaxID=270368 RepID=UPI001414F689|nr:hypothetical protein [Roseateles toxinivorans]
MKFPHIAAVVAIPIAALVASATCFEKVSTSTVLCFSQSERAISPHVAADLDRLLERSKDFGPVVTLFGITIPSSSRRSLTSEQEI